MNQYRQGQLQLGQGNLAVNQGNLAVHQSNANIQRMAEQRAQEMMPYLQQQYKDQHNKAIPANKMAALKSFIAQKQFDSIMGQMNGGNNSQQTPPPQQNTQPPNEMGSPNPNVSLQDVMQPIMQPNYGSQVQPQPNVNQVPQPQPEQQSKSGSPSQQGQQEEIELRPANKGSEFADKFVGTELGGKLKNQYKNGYMYTEYPSGRVTVKKMPEGVGAESPADKRRETFELRDQLAINKENRKKFEDNKKYTKQLIPYMKTIASLKDILDKNPNLTGLSTSLFHKAKQARNPALGTFTSGALALQTAATKELSNVGGSRAAGIVSAAKPDISNNVPFNQGVLKDLTRKTVASFLEAKREAEELGKEFPYKLENIYKTLEIKSPSGEIAIMPTEKALKLLEEGPDYMVEG